MRIFYDGQIYERQVTGGINRYFSNIINRLPENSHPTLTTVHRKNKIHYPTHPNLKLQEYRSFRPHIISNRVRTQYFRWLCSRTSHDIHHPTYYSWLTREPCSKTATPLVITVYDMIHELFADTLDPMGYTIRLKRAAIQAADAIICISHSTKNDLLTYFPNVEDKVAVTYLASEFSSDWAYGNESIPPAPYFLYVGSRTKEYKNFDTLLVAFSKAASINSDIQLCVVGSPFNAEEQQQINELRLANRIQHYKYASDSHLAKLYRCSIAFVYPSLYEGFGIPPLEAMTCGTAVIAADSSSIPEVVGDAGILFPPRSTGDLADIMLSLLDSISKRDLLIEKGHKRRQQFNWNKTTEQTIVVYGSLL